MKKYKLNFKRDQTGIKKKDWRGNYIWDKGNESINYIYMLNIHDNSSEIIEIIDDYI